MVLKHVAVLLVGSSSAAPQENSPHEVMSSSSQGDSGQVFFPKTTQDATAEGGSSAASSSSQEDSGIHELRGPHCLLTNSVYGRTQTVSKTKSASSSCSASSSSSTVLSATTSLLRQCTQLALPTVPPCATEKRIAMERGRTINEKSSSTRSAPARCLQERRGRGAPGQSTELNEEPVEELSPGSGASPGSGNSPGLSPESGAGAVDSAGARSGRESEGSYQNQRSRSVPVGEPSESEVRCPHTKSCGKTSDGSSNGLIVDEAGTQWKMVREVAGGWDAMEGGAATRRGESCGKTKKWKRTVFRVVLVVLVVALVLSVVVLIRMLCAQKQEKLLEGGGKSPLLENLVSTKEILPTKKPKNGPAENGAGPGTGAGDSTGTGLDDGGGPTEDRRELTSSTVVDEQDFPSGWSGKGSGGSRLPSNPEHPAVDHSSRGGLPSQPEHPADHSSRGGLPSQPVGGPLSEQTSTPVPQAGGSSDSTTQTSPQNAGERTATTPRSISSFQDAPDAFSSPRSGGEPSPLRPRSDSSGRLSFVSAMSSDDLLRGLGGSGPLGGLGEQGAGAAAGQVDPVGPR